MSPPNPTSAGRRLRIAYIHQYYNNPQMAGGTRSYETARRLVARGHEVHVITTDRTGSAARWRRTCDDGIQVHWCGVPYANAMSHPQRVRAFLVFAAAAAARTRAVCPDLVLASSTPLTVAIPGVAAARSRRVPFVFEVRDLWPEAAVELGALRNPMLRRAAYALARFAYRNADEVVVLSPGMADGVRRYGFPSERITLVPNAADVDVFTVDPARVEAFRSGLEWLGERPLVVYAGTVGPIHGVDWLVDLAVQTRRRDPDVRFLVVGDGKDEPHVRDYAAAAGVLGDNFFMSPPVPKRDVAVVVAAATAATSLVGPVPILEDNSANKFFDALAAGKPVLINYGGWHADLIRTRGAGLVFDRCDVGAAADRLVASVRDDAWVEAAGAAARQLATDEFARDLLFRRLEGALAKAVGRREQAVRRS